MYQCSSNSQLRSIPFGGGHSREARRVYFIAKMGINWKSGCWHDSDRFSCRTLNFALFRTAKISSTFPFFQQKGERISNPLRRSFLLSWRHLKDFFSYITFTSFSQKKLDEIKNFSFAPKKGRLRAPAPSINNRSVHLYVCCFIHTS